VPWTRLRIWLENSFSPDTGLGLLSVFEAVSIGTDCSIEAVSEATAAAFDPECLSELVFRKPTATAAAIAIAPVAGIIPERHFCFFEVRTAGLISSVFASWILAADSSELKSI
jgi:hypothetical protein